MRFSSLVLIASSIAFIATGCGSDEKKAATTTRKPTINPQKSIDAAKAAVNAGASQPSGSQYGNQLLEATKSYYDEIQDSIGTLNLGSPKDVYIPDVIEVDSGNAGTSENLVELKFDDVAMSCYYTGGSPEVSPLVYSDNWNKGLLYVFSYCNKGKEYVPGKTFKASKLNLRVIEGDHEEYLETKVKVLIWYNK